MIGWTHADQFAPLPSVLYTQNNASELRRLSMTENEGATSTGIELLELRCGEGRVDHRVFAFDREPEPRHREPVDARGDFGVDEARIADRGRCDHNVLYPGSAAAAEQPAGDDSVVVP